MKDWWNMEFIKEWENWWLKTVFIVEILKMAKKMDMVKITFQKLD